MVYSSALWLHSLLRWAILVSGAAAWFLSIRGAGGRGTWTEKEEMWGTIFIITLDTQLVVGLGLYAFLSPFTKIAFQNFSAAMTNAGLRFWSVEHIAGMIAGIAFAHVGRVKVRNASSDRSKHVMAAIFFGLALAAIIVSIPWPGESVGRPLIRF